MADHDEQTSDYVTWRGGLQNGEEWRALYPDTFDIPSEYERRHLRPGDTAKLTFATPGASIPGERMWVQVTEETKPGYIGRLCNTPVAIDGVAPGDLIPFGAEHVLDIGAEVDR
jgi:hypothetical protein